MTKKIDDQNILKSEVDADKFPKLAKATELANNYKIRAEKAEAESKKAKAEVEPSKKPEETITPKKEVETETPKQDYSLQDIRALNDVHDDDVETVTEWAKFKGISIAEAKKTPEITTLLRENTEERKTAEATNTGGGKRGSTKSTSKQILDKIHKGEALESDADYDKLAAARLKAQEESR